MIKFNAYYWSFDWHGFTVHPNLITDLPLWCHFNSLGKQVFYDFLCSLEEFVSHGLWYFICFNIPSTAGSMGSWKMWGQIHHWPRIEIHPLINGCCWCTETHPLVGDSSICLGGTVHNSKLINQPLCWGYTIVHISLRNTLSNSVAWFWGVCWVAWQSGTWICFLYQIRWFWGFPVISTHVWASDPLSCWL